jgi:3-oxoadipate enol-lactonase
MSNEMRTRDGTRIVYDVGGRKQFEARVALIHSLGMDRNFWRPVTDRLGAEAAVLTYDCRGHGASDKPKGPYTVEQFADDLADLLTHVDWQTSVVAGASMGGCVSLAFVARYPERTRAIGLFDTTACYQDAKAWADRADAAVKNGLASLSTFQVTRWFGDEFRAAHPTAVQSALDTFLANDLAAYAETCRMLGAADLRSHLSGIKVPTRILVGEEDYATPPKMAEELHRRIAGSTYTLLPKARHLTPLEHPDKIAEELKALLRA